MKKCLLIPVLCTLLAASCTEVPVTIDDGTLVFEESTHVSSDIEDPETKNFLIEDVTGVSCVNCPLGTEKLDELNAQNNNRLHVVAVHQSSFSLPYEGSAYDFRTGVDGKSIIIGIFGSQGNPPTACFDRWPIGNSSTYLVDGQTNFAAAVAEMKNRESNTPLNMKVAATYNSETDQYDIEVTIHYTEAVTAQHGLSIYLTESNIVDLQLTPQGMDPAYVFNHVFRKCVLPAAGRIYLADFATKEAGRVYVCRTSVKIDTTDPFQATWKPENMEVVAFVSVADNPDDKHVIQVQKTKLKG